MVEARDLTRGEADFGIVGLWSWVRPSSQNLIFLFLELIRLMLQGFVANVEDDGDIPRGILRYTSVQKKKKKISLIFYTIKIFKIHFLHKNNLPFRLGENRTKCGG